MFAELSDGTPEGIDELKPDVEAVLEYGMLDYNAQTMEISKRVSASMAYEARARFSRGWLQGTT